MGLLRGEGGLLSRSFVIVFVGWFLSDLECMLSMGLYNVIFSFIINIDTVAVCTLLFFLA